MDRLLFAPFGIVAGLLAGFAGKLAFDKVWSLIDDQEPPEPEHRDISIAKMIAALAIQGAIFRAVKGIVDHEIRDLFRRWTGAWPGEPRPEPE